MKKSKLVILSLLLAVAMISCDKDMKDKDNSGMMMMNGGVVLLEKVGSLPVSSVVKVTPYIIPGTNNGGNRTCAEVETAFEADFDLCGDKIDYYDGSFNGEFPEGLEVTVTGGKFVSFSMTNPGVNCYKVGAVIVKGSNSANVYYYPEGTLSDAGLAPPLNASGAPAGLSNITFCFIECEEGERPVVGFKAWLTNGDVCVSSGNLVFTVDDQWCSNLGYHIYLPSTTIDIIDPYTSEKFGTAEIETDGDIKITLNDGLVLNKIYLYIGTLENFETLPSGQYCPAYESWQFFDPNPNVNPVTLTPGL